MSDDATSVESTERSDAVELTIRLDDIRQLFQAPELDPFAAQERTTAGLDDVADYLTTKDLRRPPALRALLLLPSERITADLEALTKDAVSRYCDAKIARARREIEIIGFVGRKRLWLGVVALAIVGA